MLKPNFEKADGLGIIEDFFEKSAIIITVSTIFWLLGKNTRYLCQVRVPLM